MHFGVLVRRIVDQNVFAVVFELLFLLLLIERIGC